MLFVYAMTVLIAACWVGRMIVNRKLIYTKTPLDFPIYFFLLSQHFSTFFSVDPHTSIYGYYSRWNGGLLSTIAYTLLYVAFVSNARSDSVNRLIRYSVLPSATLVALYALLQRVGIDRDFWIQDVVSRVFSTQGQPNWLAAYLVMVIPFILMITVKSYIRNHKSYMISSILFMMYATAVALTRSRSGLLGFAVADVVF
jgi:hypothetical protein